MSEPNPHRLPRTVVPRRYELRLEPDLDVATFTGSEAVDVEVLEPTADVVLNAAELEIDEAWVTRPDGTQHDAKVTFDREAERAILALAAPLAAGPATVHLRFRGVLNDKLRGFYRSTFTDHEGNERVLAATQMEATDARRAFPCWDEPDAKAVFGVTLVVPEAMLAISNAGELSRQRADDDGGRMTVTFADTMPMSTYLVAFVVGPLVASDPVDVDGKPLRVVFPPGKEHLTGFALDVGAFALRYFADWFGIVYPGDKLDLVAIPDFAFGAMENVGCITFRERYVLIDPERATQAERQAVVDVIAHEIAHMWFGDLVTMKWWNGIWLNEAFATFMEMTCTDAYRPDWQRWIDFWLSRSGALDTDALTATRPIEYPVLSPDDADGMFDVLTYEKGAAVVRMLEQYLGPDRFRAGIGRYMAHHQYGNTETSDLWDALEEETGEPVRRIADSWIFQGGFPEVVAELVNGSLRLTQCRFRYEGGDDGTRWAVPVVVELAAGGNRRAERVLLDAETASLALGDGVVRVTVNPGGHGFFRVRYAPDLLALLVDNIAALAPAERFALVDDGWASVLAGSTPAADFVDLAARFGGEDDLSVWERLVGAFGQLDALVAGEGRDRLRARVDALLAPARERLGPDPVEGEGDRTRTLRGVLLQGAAVLGGDQAGLDRCRAMTDGFLDDPSSVHPSLSAPALAAAATLGDVALHDRIVERFGSADNPQDRERILRALARFLDAAAFDRTLQLSLSGDVRTQDAPYLLMQTIANRDNGAIAWAFVRDRWDEINQRFPANSIPRLLGGIRALRDRARADEVTAFVAAHPIPQGELQVAQHLERMWVTVALAEREADRFTKALGA